MKNEKYFLSIDNGTQSVRAMVFDGEGQLMVWAPLGVGEPSTNRPRTIRHRLY